VIKYKIIKGLYEKYLVVCTLQDPIAKRIIVRAANLRNALGFLQQGVHTKKKKRKK